MSMQPCMDFREGAYPRTRGQEGRRTQRGGMHRVTIQCTAFPRQMGTSSGSLPESELRSAKWGSAEKIRGPAPKHTWSIILGTSQDKLMIAFCTASFQTQRVEGTMSILTHVTQQHNRDKMTSSARVFLLLLLQNLHICRLSNFSVTLYSQWLFIHFSRDDIYNLY